MAKNKAAQKLGLAGGKKRWAAATKKQRSEAMRALAMKRHGKNVAVRDAVKPGIVCASFHAG